MDWINILMIMGGVVIVIVLFWLLASKPKSSSKMPISMTSKNVNREMMGMRFCSVCGTGWKSTFGMMKDMKALFGDDVIGDMAGVYSAENLAGLTCTLCEKSFCKAHLNQQIPSSIPGGKCPSCGGPMSLA